MESMTLDEFNIIRLHRLLLYCANGYIVINWIYWMTIFRLHGFNNYIFLCWFIFACVHIIYVQYDLLCCFISNDNILFKLVRNTEVGKLHLHNYILESFSNCVGAIRLYYITALLTYITYYVIDGRKKNFSDDFTIHDIIVFILFTNMTIMSFCSPKRINSFCKFMTQSYNKCIKKDETDLFNYELVDIDANIVDLNNTVIEPST